ncbi:patatin-like phospholipase family protein [Flagellimonas alvinocaridis]|nr:patatin-like phospholipase family protein [Allomuricauda alvinocaridis]
MRKVTCSPYLDDFMSLFVSRKLPFYVLLIFLVTSISGFSQDKKPKVALVLSGGGAKGLAHIPTLQALDSLGIKPDLLVGNSMGSIVGGLYALGYSGDSIASIAKKANWEQLMGGRVSLKNVSVEEKTEFNRYLVELDWVEGKIKLGSFLLNDQKLREFIATLTFPSYNINHFDKLPIPFRAVATDIVNGKEVILDNGSLSFAMRASMSIPGVFSAVPYKETLLIDGGVLNNFPVDVAKNMGADIIIGSDVGGGMMDKEKLQNISSLLFQAGMLSSNLKNPENRALCDILIDHTNHLTFSTGDFQKSAQIYEEGKLAVAENMTPLTELSNLLKNYNQPNITLPVVEDKILLDTIVYNNISKTNLALVKARTNLKTNTTYSKQEIVDGINRAMGTTIFSQITFEPLVNDKKLGIQLNGFERSKHQVKGALHYDDYHGVGILVNYTGRNILGAASRSLITLDVAEQPRFRLQHQKNFGSDRDWWWRTEALGQRLKQQVFIGGEAVDDIKYRYFQFENQINRNINSLTSYVGIGLKYQNTYLKPTVDPKLNENIFGLKSYAFNAIQLNAHYLYNTMDAVFFATNGTNLMATVGRSFYNDVEVKFSNPDIPTEEGSTDNYTKLGFNYEKRFPLSTSSTAIIGASANFILVDDGNANNVSFNDFGVGAKYFLGGNQLDPRQDSFMFPGLNEGELTASQFIKLNLGLQYKLKANLYILPHVDAATVGFNDFKDYFKDAFTANGQWQDSNTTSFLFSSGVTLGYNSILGPVNFDVSWVNDINKVRIFIGVGFPLNRSN